MTSSNASNTTLEQAHSANSANNADALFHLGNACIPLQQFDQALAHYEQALAIQPDHAPALCNRGNIFIILNRFEDALISFDQALAIQPNYADAIANRGMALISLQRFEEALTSFDKVLTLQPNHANALAQRGSILLLYFHRFEAALASLDHALALRPDDAITMVNRGAALHRLQRFDEALASFDQAIALQPQNIDMYLNRGGALQRLNRFDAALADYAHALALQPDYAEAHWSESICRLTMGDFALGWQKYEWRWKRKQSTSIPLPLRNFSQPLWLGKESLRHKTILLHAEQGLGDTIQFCRYARKVAALGATVILEVQPSLKTLLRNVEGVTHIIAQGEALPSFDFHCPLLSLPLAFHTDLASIPFGSNVSNASDAKPASFITRALLPLKRWLPHAALASTSALPASYLSADALHKARWQNKLGVKTSPRIGLAWSGSTTHVNDHHRSIPLMDFMETQTQKHAQFYCLQKELRPNDQALLNQLNQANKQPNNQPNKIVFVGDELNDFADTAALIDAMDLVITVDTSIAHLAGAMGKPVWILLPFNADWRWLSHRNDSPWYPSARLFRQPAIGDWRSVLAAVKQELT